MSRRLERDVEELRWCFLQQRVSQVAGWTGLEPGSLRRGNHLAACELWSQRVEGQLIKWMGAVRQLLAESSRIYPIRGDILETSERSSP
jgi:hypothetical protein